jgi:O-antigen/teichoic acid export membrane protein
VLKRLGRDVAIYGGADLLFKLLQFAFIPLYSHRLSVAEFGVLALVTVSAALAGILVNLGVSYSVQRFYFDADLPEARRPVLVTTGLVQLLVSGTLLLFLLGLALGQARGDLASEYHLPWVFVLVGLLTVLPDQVAQYSLDASRLQFAPWRFCAIALVKNVLGLLIGLWLLLERDMGVLGLLAGNLIAAVLAAPLGLWLIRRDLTWRIDPAYSAMMLRFGSPFIFTAAAYWIFASMDRWLLAELSDPVQVGLFSIAFKFAAILTLVIGAFHQAWVPIAMRMARDEPRYRDIFSAIFDGWFFLLALMALGIGLFADEVMMVLTPEPYWAAADILVVGAAAVAMSGTTQITSLGLTLEKRTVMIALGAWLAAGVNVLLNLLLIPRFGALGSAMATLLSYTFLTGFFLLASQRVHPLPLNHARLGYGLLLVGATLAAPLVPDGSLLDPVRTALKLVILLAALAAAFPLGVVPPGVVHQLRTLRKSVS